MRAWLIAYDLHKRKVLGCYPEEPGETYSEFLVRARRLTAIWARLRPSVIVEMRRGDDVEDLIRNNPWIFRTEVDKNKARTSVGHQRRSRSERHLRSV